QDVAIDALAVEVLPAEERGTANGFMFGGQSVGQAVGGSGIMLLGASLPFESTYFVAVGLMAVILIGVSWRLRERAAVVAWTAGVTSEGRWTRIGLELRNFIRAAWRAFAGTRAASLGVLFAAL